MQQIMSSTSKVIVDQKGGQNLLYLPLDRIMQMATQTQQGSTVTIDTSRGTPETTQPVVPDNIPTRRDSLRSRERESGR